ncbi:MAG: nitroreductase family protein [Actinobacteria bacterium]|nr:nitroreductase family protein [Actinomycetota bacterium]
MTIDRAATDKLLTTTRSVRKRLDLSRSVEPEVIAECIDIAMQAPTGTNAQNWAFVVVTDPEKRRAIADVYRKGGEVMAGSGYPPPLPEGDPREHVMPKVMESAEYLGSILEHVPVFVIACVKGRVENVPMVIAQASTYGSILPAAWSFMLALRARGLGTAWTTIHLFSESEVSTMLGIPEDWTQTVLFPVAYYTGDDFKPAHRLPSNEMTHWDSWGTHR